MYCGGPSESQNLVIAEIFFTSSEPIYSPLGSTSLPLRKHAFKTMCLLKIICLYSEIFFMFRNLIYLEFTFVRQKCNYFARQGESLIISF